MAGSAEQQAASYAAEGVAAKAAARSCPTRRSLWQRFTREEWMTLLALGSVHFGSSLCIALQAPFFPREAETKGASATEYGLVFGIFELTSFISSPLFGKYMDYIGAKQLLTGGIVVASVCAIMFGLLDLVQTHLVFITLSFLVRTVEALGSSAAVTAAFSITASVFSDSVATTFATLEVFYGFGYIIGPTLGGLLFWLGGYTVPFMVMGILLALDGVFVWWALPAVNDGRTVRTQGNLFRVLQVPAVLLDMFAIMATAVSMGFLTATLEPHLRREFMLPAVSVGFIFITSATVYAVTAPLIGRLCDRSTPPHRLVLCGAVCVACSYLFIGPLPFVPVDPQLSVTIIGLMIHGLGVACILVPCFIDAIRAAVDADFPDDITTHGLISGLWASSFALGDFIGPSVAGVLFDLTGFRVGMLFVVGLHILLLAIVGLYSCLRQQRCRGPRRRSYAFLVTPPSSSPSPPDSPLSSAHFPKFIPASESSETMLMETAGNKPSFPMENGSSFGYGSMATTIANTPIKATRTEGSQTHD